MHTDACMCMSACMCMDVCIGVYTNVIQDTIYNRTFSSTKYMNIPSKRGHTNKKRICTKYLEEKVLGSIILVSVPMG